jgi:hypothetical protein
MRLTPQLTHDGASRSAPSRLSHPPQFEPSHQRWNMARLVPRAKQSMRLAPQLLHSGVSRIVPPRLSHPLHWARACGARSELDAMRPRTANKCANDLGNADRMDALLRRGSREVFSAAVLVNTYRYRKTIGNVQALFGATYYIAVCALRTAFLIGCVF